jgi:hypothetical protein
MLLGVKALGHYTEATLRGFGTPRIYFNLKRV